MEQIMKEEKKKKQKASHMQLGNSKSDKVLSEKIIQMWFCNFECNFLYVCFSFSLTRKNHHNFSVLKGRHIFFKFFQQIFLYFYKNGYNKIAVWKIKKIYTVNQNYKILMFGKKLLSNFPFMINCLKCVEKQNTVFIFNLKKIVKIALN